MKIFFSIAFFYPSQKGGPANSIYWMAKALKRHGVQNTIVATDAGIQNNTVPVEQWIQTEAGSVIYTREINYTFWPKLIWKSIFQIKSSDIVQLTSLFAFSSLFVALASVIQGKNVVWSPRGELDDQALIYSSFKKKPVLWFVKRFLTNRVTFHGTSNEEIMHISRIFGKRANIIHIPNLIELPALLNGKSGIGNYLLFIGRIHPIKALDQLVRALSVSDRFMKSSYTLIIAGNSDSDYGTTLQNLVNSINLHSKVQFIGQVEGEAKQSLYAKAYFTFLPSHTENFGNVVVESLAQGTPVVASTGTPWEIIPQRNAGYWIDNSVAALSQTIDHILNLDPELYQTMRQNARCLCEDQFDVDKNIDKWINAYSQMIDG